MLQILPDFTNSEVWISLITLTFLEIVLGIDNIIFISIIADKLPATQQKKARNLGLSIALIMRLVLLFTISWMMKLTDPVIPISFIPDPQDATKPLALSWKDIILIAGGIFLIYKTTKEILHKIQQKNATHVKENAKVGFNAIVLQIILLDAVFSVDSILTAIGLVESIAIMIIAVILSMVVMLVFAGNIINFINKYPSLKVLALVFLIAIGVVLVAGGVHYPISKAYIYVALGFSLFVEFINIKVNKA
jgi:predicted tellurium resistance membrane protein TerC